MHSTPLFASGISIDPASAVKLHSLVEEVLPAGTSIVATIEARERLLISALMSATLTDSGKFAIDTERVEQLITELASSGELVLMPSKLSKPTTTPTSGPEKS